MTDPSIGAPPQSETLAALERRRQELRERRAEVQQQLDARIARDDALIAERDRRQARIDRNLAHSAMQQALCGIFHIEATHAMLRGAALCLHHFGAPAPTVPPPREMPPELHDRFTLGGRVPVAPNFFDDTCPANHPLIYTDAEIDCYLDRIAHNEYYIYGTVDYWLWEALTKYPVAGLTVAVMGSVTPWFEAACIKFGARPTTIEYNTIVTRTGRIAAMTVEQWERERPRFDAAISISSFEHDGLGAYGDPIDPDGDLKAMKRMKKIVKPGGLMFFNVPLGPDHLIWNRNRSYGPLRLPLLLDGWTTIDSFGMEPQFLARTAGGEPLMVLRND
jgi:Caenorhabditis protein of unknown function, DUF268